jgi:sarcosine oxidase subunit gamma
MRLMPPATRFILHGDAAARAAAAPVWGAGFAEQACRAVVVGSRATLWLGPDEYLLLAMPAAAAESPGSVGETLERALENFPHALVDVSHRQFALQLSGPHAAAILNSSCPLDLDLREFPIGMCTRTVLAKAEIVLWRTAEEEFHVEIWRSFAGYVTGLLREVAIEFHGV